MSLITDRPPGAPWANLVPACPGGTVLIFAVSGLGKSTLAAAHPTRVLDTDTLLYEAVATGFPEHEPRARLRAWRDLCRRQPWVEGGEALERWASIRRAFIEPFIAAMRASTHALAVTSVLDPPWVVSASYGITRGRYMEHLRLAGREADNHQSEATNHRLEGYTPLVRVPPGTFLGDRPEIMAVVRGEAPSRG